MMNSEEIQKKVKSYENFVEGLKNDLKEIEENLDDKVSKYKDWEEVKIMTDIVKEFKEEDSDMLVRVDIGKGILVNGKIVEYERMYVDVGLGIILEMDPEETIKYSDIRLRLLKKEIEHFRKLAVDVKVHIKMVLLAISELQRTVLTALEKNSY